MIPSSKEIYILNELPRSRAARYQKEFLFNPDAEHRGIRLIKREKGRQPLNRKRLIRPQVKRSIKKP